MINQKNPRFYLKILSITSLLLFSVSFITIANAEDCLVPCDDIVGGGPGPDGIPAVENPTFQEIAEFESGYSGDLENLYVLGVVIDGEARAYPRDMLNWHEIVNDEFNDEHVCVTFCPLTGTGILYDTSSIGGSTLGTSGKLYENNLVFYDRDSGSLWSQMLGVSLKGEKISERIPIQPITETTWQAWKTLHPDTVILNRDSGKYTEEIYNTNPYPGYRNRGDIWFRTSFRRLNEPYNLYDVKALTLVLEIENQVRLYPFEELEKQPVLNDILSNQSIFLIFDAANELVLTYNSSNPNPSENNSILHFTQVETNLPESKTFGFPVFQDQTGTIWNFLGKAIDGPYDGSSLQQLPSYNAFWFAATALYPELEIFTGNSSVSYILTFEPSDDPGSSVPSFLILDVILFALGIVVVYRLLKSSSLRRKK
ncbi:MAG: DUF3179 domain-containing protein [Candidatus Hodarchaeales archaeon]|jgi:hypothetical protein